MLDNYKTEDFQYMHKVLHLSNGVSIWVHNGYMKIYNKFPIWTSTKCIRISLYSAEYIYFKNVDFYKFTNRELKKFIDLLLKTSPNQNDITIWQDIILNYVSVYKQHTSYDKCLKEKLYNNYPMPNYIKLNGN